MSIWFRKRLAVCICISLLSGGLLWNGEILRAQGAFNTESPKAPQNKKLTRDGTAKAFVLFLNTHNNDAEALADWAKSSVVSAKTRRELVGTEQVEEFMGELRAEWKRTTYNLKVLKTKGKTAIITLENNTSQPVRPIVLIEENGVWGIDITETYAKWNILRGVSRKDALARLVG
ncbi:hypothetical protein IAD21_05147 [Abditibacteriota bacterium]|nr:hypothetical protein IAD21_05147 [Abditibacteriota bacterium]